MKKEFIVILCTMVLYSCKYGNITVEISPISKYVFINDKNWEIESIKFIDDNSTILYQLEKSSEVIDKDTLFFEKNSPYYISNGTFRYLNSISSCDVHIFIRKKNDKDVLRSFNFTYYPKDTSNQKHRIKYR